MSRRGRPPAFSDDELAAMRALFPGDTRRTLLNRKYLMGALSLATPSERKAVEAGKGLPIANVVLIELGRVLMAGVPREDVRELWQLVKQEHPPAQKAARAIRQWRLGQITADMLLMSLLSGPRARRYQRA